MISSKAMIVVVAIVVALLTGILIGVFSVNSTTLPSWKELRKDGESISKSMENILRRSRDYATLVEARARDEGEEDRVINDCKRLKARAGDAYAATTCILREVDELIEEENRAAEKTKSK